MLTSLPHRVTTEWLTNKLQQLKQEENGEARPQEPVFDVFPSLKVNYVSIGEGGERVLLHEAVSELEIGPQIRFYHKGVLCQMVGKMSGSDSLTSLTVNNRHSNTDVTHFCRLLNFRCLSRTLSQLHLHLTGLSIRQFKILGKGLESNKRLEWVTLDRIDKNIPYRVPWQYMVAGLANTKRFCLATSRISKTDSVESFCLAKVFQQTEGVQVARFHLIPQLVLHYWEVNLRCKFWRHILSSTEKCATISTLVMSPVVWNCYIPESARSFHRSVLRSAGICVQYEDVMAKKPRLSK